MTEELLRSDKILVTFIQVQPDLQSVLKILCFLLMSKGQRTVVESSILV